MSDNYRDEVRAQAEAVRAKLRDEEAAGRLVHDDSGLLRRPDDIDPATRRPYRDRQAETPHPMAGSPAWLAEQPARIAEQEARTATAAADVATALQQLADAARILADAEAVESVELATLEQLRRDLAAWSSTARAADQLATVHRLHPAGPVETPRTAPGSDPRETAEQTQQRAATVAELDELARVPYPHREEDAATLARLGVREDVAGRVLAYLARRNEQDAEHCARSGYWFARSEVYTVEQTDRARKWVRLVRLNALNPAPVRRARGGSIDCWLELATGRLVQADGWRNRTGRVIADLSTEEGAARLLRR